MWGSTFARITQLGSHLLAGVLLVVLGTALGAALLAGLRRTLRGGNFESDHRADQPTPSALVG